jgi:hypothetical protein
MHGWRSLNLELIPLDPELERTLRRNLKTLAISKPTIEMGDQPVPKNVDLTRSLRDLFVPVAINSPSCIVLPPTNAMHFDVKPYDIQLLLSFHSLEMETTSHVKKFKDMCTTFKFQNFSVEFVHLRLFPFSLHDRAKAWLDSNMPGSITFWEILLSKFYNKFFPMSKVNECRKEISLFTQE